MALVAGLGTWPASAATRPAVPVKASGAPAPLTKAAWQKDMAHVQSSGRGCFHASYPVLAWHAVTCGSTAEFPTWPAAPSRSAAAAAPAVGGGANGIDYTATVTGLITEATGTFQNVSPGITETGKVDNTGKPVKNAFTLQLNTQMFGGSPACGGAAADGCEAWQQFMYQYSNPSTSLIFMQYWLYSYGSSCPSGWLMYTGPGGGCFVNSAMAEVPTLTAAELGSVQLTGSATWDGNDAVTLMVGSGQAAMVVASDSMLGLAASWNTTQWGVYGDDHGAEAVFKPTTGASLEAVTSLAGSIGSGKPTVEPGSFTRESNNLGLAATPPLGAEQYPTMASEQNDDGATGVEASAATAPGTASPATSPDVPWDDDFTAYGNTSGAWSGGDGAQSLELPDGNTMWFFADTYLGQVNPDGTRPPLATGIAHNSAVLYNADTGTLGPTFAASGSGGYNYLTDYSWVDPPPGYPPSQYEMINGDQVIDDGYAFKFYQLADTDLKPDGFPYKLVGTVMEDFTISGDTLTPGASTIINQVQDTLGSNPTIWGTAVLVADGYIYIYGTKPYNGSADPYPLYLARVPVDGLATGAPWQYFDSTPGCGPAAASAWSLSAADATQLMPEGVSSGFSVTDVDGTYVLLTNDSSGTYNNAVAYYANCPTGFSASSPNYLVYAPDVPSGYLTYEYRIVPQFSDLADGDVLVSYSQDSSLEDGSCMLENYYDVTIYRPRFLDVQLPNLPQPSGSGGNIKDPPDIAPEQFGTPPVSPDNFYAPTQDYPGTSTEMQDYCTAGASPSSSPTLTVTGNANDVVDVSWSMQPSAMWLYTVVYCDVSFFGAGDQPGECPPDLVGPEADDMTNSIPACNTSAASTFMCGYNLNWGNTSSTLTDLNPGSVYEIEICTALAVWEGGYVGSNVLTVTAT